MLDHLMIVEIIALVTGLIVIAIETVIIFMLKRHINALDRHFISTDKLIGRFEKEINHHLEHLNGHSHHIETMLKQLCTKDLDWNIQSRGNLKSVQKGKAGSERVIIKTGIK